MAEKPDDLAFLREIRERLEKGRAGDPTQTEFALNMIDDWVEELSDPQPSDAEVALADVHARLDAAGIPSAQGVVCDDPGCQTKAGHRVMVLVNERDAFKDGYKSREIEVRKMRQAISDLTAERRGEVWFWQGDGEDHLESLTCPIQIGAEQMRQLLEQIDAQAKTIAYLHDLGRERENTIPVLEKRLEEFHQSNERLQDLVRYARGFFHEEGLISDGEYAELVQIDGAVKRLEGYDVLRRENDRLRLRVHHLEEAPGEWAPPPAWEAMEACPECGSPALTDGEREWCAHAVEKGGVGCDWGLPKKAVEAA